MLLTKRRPWVMFSTQKHGSCSRIRRQGTDGTAGDAATRIKTQTILLGASSVFTHTGNRQWLSWNRLEGPKVQTTRIWNNGNTENFMCVKVVLLYPKVSMAKGTRFTEAIENRTNKVANSSARSKPGLRLKREMNLRQHGYTLAACLYTQT